MLNADDPFYVGCGSVHIHPWHHYEGMDGQTWRCDGRNVPMIRRNKYGEPIDESGTPLWVVNLSAALDRMSAAAFKLADVLERIRPNIEKLDAELETNRCPRIDVHAEHTWKPNSIVTLWCPGNEPKEAGIV